MRRVHAWSFRLQQEAEQSDSAWFVTLTYDNEHVPITTKKLLTLQKRDIQLFIKRLRKLTDIHSKDPLRKKIKYYAAGEYGPETYRPHYHLIIFNAEPDLIEQAWKSPKTRKLQGDIKFGDLTPASAAYTLKYISKDSIKHFHGDDREREFSLMSKRLGSNYLDKDTIFWHRQQIKGQLPERYHLMQQGYRIAMPRYYKEKIWSKMELQIIGLQFITFQDEQYAQQSIKKRLALFKQNEQLREYFSMRNEDSRDTTI